MVAIVDAIMAAAVLVCSKCLTLETLDPFSIFPPQAADSKNNGKANQLYLPLAEKLIDKYFEKDVDSEAEVRLYLMVLDKQRKTEKKLIVLKGPTGEIGTRTGQLKADRLPPFVGNCRQ